MANTIKLRRSATAGAVPTTSNLALGELAMNTADGKLFMKTDDGAGTVEIAEIGAGGSITISSSPPADPDAGDIYWDQDDGSAYIYYIDADSTAQWVPLTPLADTPVPGSNAYKIDDISSSFNGVLTDFTINVDGSAHEPAYINATLISLGGVIQQPTTAYTISGSTISFASAPSSGVDFFGIDLAAALPIGTPNDGTVTPAKLSTGGPYWNVSGDVGIGTTSPTTLLEIKSDGTAANEARLTINEKYNDSATGFGVDFKRTYDTGGDAQDAGYIRLLRNGGTTNLGLTFGVGDRGAISERMRIDSSGRVLIGTTTEGQSPSGETLTVANNGHCGITVRSSSTTTGNLFFSDGTSGTDEYAGAIVYDHASNALNLYTNGGQERMRIDASGKVGIGTSSPSSFNSDGNNLVVGSGSGGQGMSIYSGTSSYGTIYFADGTSGDALYRGSILYNHASDFMRFDTAAGERMRIDSSGNVGIGTSSASDKLQVSGGIRATGEAAWGSGAEGAFIDYYAAGSMVRIGHLNGSSGSAKNINFYSGGSNVLAITSTGNVGIGTSNPTNTLHVNGSTYVHNNLTVGAYDTSPYLRGIRLFPDNGGRSTLVLNGDGTSNTAIGIYDGNASSYKTKLQHDGGGYFLGNIMIGTTSAATNANVTVRATSPQLSLYATPANISRITLGDTDDHDIGQIGYDNSDNSMFFGTNNTTRMSIDSSGNVGIGLTAPQNRIHIASSGANPAYLHSTNASSGTGATDGVVMGLGNASDVYYWNYENGAQVWATSATERMRIAANGDIGLGTSNPIAKVDMNGLAVARDRLLVGTVSATNQSNRVLQMGDTTHANTYAEIRSSTTGVGGIVWSDGTGTGPEGYRGIIDYTHATNAMRFSTNATERMNLSYRGQLNVYGDWTSFISRSGTGAGTVEWLVAGAHSASNTNSGTISFLVYTNGNVQNTNDSYGQISDIKLKENIVDAESQWDDFKAIRFRKYNFKEETGYETHTQLGVIAQELELTCPGLVYETPDRDEEGNVLSTTTKAVKSSILTKKGLVALQEAMARIETLEQRLSNAGIA